MVYINDIDSEQEFLKIAPVAQLDRASGYGPEGCRFDSYRVHHLSFFSFHSRINQMTIKPFCIRIVESSDFDMLAAYEKHIGHPAGQVASEIFLQEII